MSERSPLWTSMFVPEISVYISGPRALVPSRRLVPWLRLVHWLLLPSAKNVHASLFLVYFLGHSMW
jgi:hypothetical protein